MVVVVEGSAASLGGCLLGAGLEGGALLLGGGAVGLCFSSKPTTTCLEAGYAYDNTCTTHMYVDI